MEIFNDRIIIWLKPHHKWVRVYKEFVSLLTSLLHQKTTIPWVLFFWSAQYSSGGILLHCQKQSSARLLLFSSLIFYLFLSFIISVCVKKKHTRKMLGWMALRHSLILHLASFFWLFSLSLSFSLFRMKLTLCHPYCFICVCVCVHTHGPPKSA